MRGTDHGDDVAASCKFWAMSNRTAGQEPDMTVRAVAEHLGLHPETVRIMTRSGDFPNAYKTGRGGRANHIRIPWSDVEDYRKKQPRVNR